MIKKLKDILYVNKMSEIFLCYEGEYLALGKNYIILLQYYKDIAG